MARSGRSELTTTILTTDQVAELVVLMLRPTGRRIDLSSPLEEFTKGRLRSSELNP